VSSRAQSRDLAVRRLPRHSPQGDAGLPFIPHSEFRVEVVSECIGKCRIRRVHFRMASRAEFQAAEFAPAGGNTIAASA